MQSKPPSHPTIINGKVRGVKRTTIILEPKEREFIQTLITEGKEPGIKQLISKMIDIYKNMMIYDWKFPGEYYCGISRVVFINVEFLNILTQQIPKEQWCKIGERMGDVLKVSIQSTLGVDASKQEHWPAVFERLKVQGFGDFYLKDKFLLLKTPFIHECDIWKGIMEGLLSVELETRNAIPPLVFEVKKHN
ncbi:MAG: hypothetical protein NWE98_04660 [Candidatus Bathyarchaeota archaeon]|nr:hypothetical protein [Candidatus Bathyarchaeota archaeon]